MERRKQGWTVCLQSARKHMHNIEDIEQTVMHSELKKTRVEHGRGENTHGA